MGLIDLCQETSQAPYDVPKVRLTSVVSSKNDAKSGLSSILNDILLVEFRKVNDLYLMLDLVLEYTGHLFHHLNLVN